MVLDSVAVWLEMNLILLSRDCGDRREGCTVAGGITESGIAEIAVFLRAALDRATTMTEVWCTWRFAQDIFKVAKYSPRWSLLDIVSNICTVRLRWDFSCI
jgi:hypothetical protein